MPTSLAASADPFQRSELAVQSPAAEVAFLDPVLHGLRGRRGRVHQDDFQARWRVHPGLTDAWLTRASRAAPTR